LRDPDKFDDGHVVVEPRRLLTDISVAMIVGGRVDVYFTGPGAKQTPNSAEPGVVRLAWLPPRAYA